MPGSLSVSTDLCKLGFPACSKQSPVHTASASGVGDEGTSKNTKPTILLFQLPFEKDLNFILVKCISENKH